jgi:hypothetical protein
MIRDKLNTGKTKNRNKILKQQVDVYLKGDRSKMRRLDFLIILFVAFISGCSGTMDEVITSDPYSADIYWGKTKSDLEKSGYKTPNSRSVSESDWASGCYQVKKEGYHDSEVICRQKEDYRHLDFRLIPIETVITSEPPGATIFWGPAKDQLKKTIYLTPRNEMNVSDGANWKDWYFQVKKEGYVDSEIMFKTEDSKDRHVHFELEPAVESALKRNKPSGPIPPVNHYIVFGDRATLSWDDRSGNELGFKIERKTESEKTYREIVTVGQNVTTYTDTGLSKATTYYYRVRAYNASGDSAPSEEISVKISDQ